MHILYADSLEDSPEDRWIMAYQPPIGRIVYAVSSFRGENAAIEQFQQLSSATGWKALSCHQRPSSILNFREEFDSVLVDLPHLEGLEYL